ncbi:MAG: iron ABC transporter permease [Lentimicrobium sp.]
MHYSFIFRRSLAFRISVAFFLLLIFVLLFIANLSVGAVKVSFSELMQIFMGKAGEWDRNALVVHEFRMPQALMAILAGASLSIGGLLMQALFRNPLADPSILGISSGASLGVAIVTMAAGNLTGISIFNAGVGGYLSITVSAFIGSLGVLLLLIFFSSRLKNISQLLILGLMVGYLSYSIVSLLKFYSLKDDLQHYVIWGMGSFSEVNMEQMKIVAPVVLIGLLFSLLLAKPLNLLLLGEEYAQNLGLKLNLSRTLVILIAGFLTSIITAWCGPIAFVGLAVPHLCRSILSTHDHRILLPFCMLAGAVLTLICNFIARLPIFGGALPLNAITSLIGAPIMITVILRLKN